VGIGQYDLMQIHGQNHAESNTGLSNTGLSNTGSSNTGSSTTAESKPGDHDERHDYGLAYDLGEFQRRGMTQAAATASRGSSRLASSVGDASGFDRRNLLKFALVAGVAGFATLGLRRSTQAQAAGCADIPEETGGPFPGDGTNGPNVLTASGAVRSDITTSFAGMKGTAAGVPLSVTFTIIDAATCKPAKGYAVYAWHADQVGRYSLYSAGATDQNYLRGVQETDASGNATFKTVFPGCYDGRWPHIHFEVFPSLQAAGDAKKRIATSQIAMPKAECEQAYGAAGYSASIANLARVGIESDGVFGDDGAVHELPTMTGSATAGFTAALNVTVSNTVKASGGGPGGPGRGPRGPRRGQGKEPGQRPAPVTTAVKKTISAAKKKTTKRTTTTKKK
jgi:protocatechuate 3,4-dioxygenase beta subunit